MIDLVAARDLHLEHLLNRHLHPDTLRAYNRAEQEYLDFLAHRDVPIALEALNPKLVDQFAHFWRSELPRRKAPRDGCAAAGARLKILKAWARFLSQKGLLQADPFRRTRSQSLLEDARDDERRARKSTELGQLIDACMSAAVIEGKTADTRRTYGRILDWLLRYCIERGYSVPSAVTPILLRACGAELLSADRQHSSLHKGGEAAVQSLFAAARYLSRWANAQGVPMPDLSNLKGPRRPQRVQPRVTAEEFRALEQAVIQRVLADSRRFSRFAVARDLALLSLLGDTGLRAIEVVAMDLDDVDLDRGVVHVGRGKGGDGRALCILDPDPTAEGGGPTLQALRNYVTQRAHVRDVDVAAFWVNNRGNRFNRNQLRAVLRRISSDAGLSGNRPPHAFRRANFTEAYRADPASIKVLAARMGWSDKSHHMIDVYTRGAEIDLAATQARPSLTRQWRGDLAGLGSISQPYAPVAPAAPVTSDLLNAIRNSPELVRALLQALHGAA